MFRISSLVVCLHLYLIHSVFSQCATGYNGHGIGYGNPGLGFNNPGLGYNNAGVGLPGPGMPNGGGYGGYGNGDIRMVGELPVAGTTVVAGQVPILGAVEFRGNMPAGGVINISGNCGCTGKPVF